MTAEGCRPWREQLGSLALGHLDSEERASLDAHLEGCPACRGEAASLRALARILPLAEPGRAAPASTPPGLGQRVAARLAEARRRTRRRRLALGVAVVAVVALAGLALGLHSFSGSDAASGRLAFAGGAGAVKISGTLQPGPLGTQIRMQVSGVRSGTLCRVFLRRRGGARSFAGTFRYRYGSEASEAVLSSGLDVSRADAVGVLVGGHTFIAPIGGEPVAETLEYREKT